MPAEQGLPTTGTTQLIDRPATAEPAGCWSECLCGGRLSRAECDARTDGLWAAVLGAPRRTR